VVGTSVASTTVPSVVSDAAAAAVDPFWWRSPLSECVGSNHVFVTNWAGVTRHLGLPCCTATLHLPLLDVTAGQRGTAIVFSPHPGDEGLKALLVADRNPKVLRRLLNGVSGEND